MGVVLLALLLAAAYGYWHFTNDARIRLKATEYLEGLTGADVRIADASFSLFGETRLKGVTVRFGAGGGGSFFHAPLVYLRHRPAALLGGRLEPMEIVCPAPEFRVEYDPNAPEGYLEALTALLARRDEDLGPLPGTLPAVRVRDASLEFHRPNGARNAAPVARWRLSLAGSVEGDQYVLRLEERADGPHPHDVSGDPMSGLVRLDLPTGEYRVVGALPDIREFDEALPETYRQWLDRYGIRGGLGVEIRSGREGDPNRYLVRLEDVSVQLPSDQGGLTLQNVTGTLGLREDGITLEDVRGTIPQGEQAGSFRIRGTYAGYGPEAPCAIDIDVQGVSLPRAEAISGRLSDLVAYIRGRYDPRGVLDASMTIERDEDGHVTPRGSIQPRGMSAQSMWFPYRLDDLRGSVAVDADGVRLEGLRGRHGPATIRIDGYLRGPGGRNYQVTVRAEDVPLDQDVYVGLKNDSRQAAWRALDPAGHANAVVVITCAGPGEPEKVAVRLELDGRAEMTYRGFPYRVEGLEGTVEIDDAGVRILSVRGRQGPMTCTVSGELDELGGPEQDIDLSIEAERLPFDDRLLDALWERPAEVLRALQPSGFAERVDVRIAQRQGREIDYEVHVALADAGFAFQPAPWPVTDVSGEVTIRPDRVLVENLRGRHGSTPVRVGGQVLLDGDQHALDLIVEADNLPLDEQARVVLPAHLGRLWQTLSPAGTADVVIKLRQRTGGDQADDRYEAVIRPRGVELTPPGDKRAIGGITGEVVATPGRIEIRSLESIDGDARAHLSGTVYLDGEAVRALLDVTAERLGVDTELLDSLPAELAPLAARFEPGGELDLRLEGLRIVTAPRAATRPARTSAATTQTGGSGGSVHWTIQSGRLTGRDVVVDLGFGRKVIFGTVEGSGGAEEEGLAFDAEVLLERVRIDERVITDLRAHLRKLADQPVIECRDLTARAYGGRLDGSAQIALDDPLEYGLSLSVDGLRLEDLRPGDDAEWAAETRGLLGGRIDLVARAGDPDTRHAQGLLRISDARIFRLPVLMGLLHVVYLTLPGDAAFSGGRVAYRLEGDTLVFEEIVLSGRGLSVLASGTLDIKTERLDVYFLAGPPGRLTGIASLDELLEGILRELVEIRVTGTLSKPRMQTLPFRSIERALRELLGPSTAGM